jgi:hypothetical protein
MTILTLEEASEFLKLSKSQLYSITRLRGKVRMSKPIPVIRVNSNLRFCKESLIAWLQELEGESQ